jgi:IclR family acetate operon transcriptional repressor
MIKVVTKTFQVLDVLHESESNGSRLSVIAAEVKLPTVTVYRILRTLVSLGYVNFDGAAETYRIAQRLKDLGQTNMAVLLTRLARPGMMRLLSEFEQTVNLALLEQGRLVYKDMVEGLQSVRMQPIPGTCLSLVNSALGISVLAFMPPEKVASLIQNSEGARGFAPLKMKALLSQLQTVRRTGYALDNQMFEKNLRCVGAPIFCKEGLPIGSISVSGSSSALTYRLIGTIAKRVKQECSQISAALGYSPRSSVANWNGAAASRSQGRRRRKEKQFDKSVA